MTAEPGWYPVEGDPPGTVRRWNGEAWIGFPTALPGTSQPTAQPVAQIEGAHRRTDQFATATPRHVPDTRQARLGILAWFVYIPLAITGIALIALGAGFAFVGATIDLDSASFELESEPAPQFDDDGSSLFSIAVVAVVIITLIAGPLFVIWFALAYRNLRLWHKTKRAWAWSIFAWFVPFLNLVRPATMMLELVENSPRPDRRGEISPVPVIAWWLLWQLPSFFVLLIALAAARSGELDGLTIAWGLAFVANGIAALLGVYLVARVTASQDRRLLKNVRAEQHNLAT